MKGEGRGEWVSESSYQENCRKTEINHKIQVDPAIIYNSTYVCTCTYTSL